MMTEKLLSLISQVQFSSGQKQRELIEKIIVLIKDPEFAEIITLTDSVLTLFDTPELSDLKVDVLDVLIKNAFIKNNDLEAEKYLKIKIENLKKSENTGDIYKSYYDLAQIYEKRGNSTESLKMYLFSLESINDKEEELLAKVHFAIGGIYRKMEEYDKAEYHFTCCTVFAKNTNNKELEMKSAGSLGIFAWQKADFKTAQKHLIKCLTMSLEENYTEGIASSYSNLGLIHHKKREHDKAIGYYKKALPFYEKLNNNAKLSTIYTNLGYVYLDDHNFEAGEIFLNKAIKYFDKDVPKPIISPAYEALADIYERKGDYKKSVEYYKKYYKIKSEHQKDINKLKIASLETEFEKKQNEKEREIFKLKNTELNELNKKLIDTNLKLQKEIFEKLQKEEKVKKTEAKYKNFLNSTFETIIIHNNGVLEYVNPSGVKLIRAESAEDVLGQSLYSFIHPDYIEKVKERIKYLMSDNIFTTPSELKLVTLDGETLDVEISSVPFIYKDRLSIKSIIKDITDIKRSREVQKVVFEISNAIHSAKDLKELFTSIRSSLSRIIDTTNFHIALYDKDTDTLSLPYYISQLDSFEKFPAGKTITKYVINTKKPFIATEEELIGMENKGLIDSVGKMCKVWAGAPLKSNNKIIGVVAVQSYSDPNIYKKRDLDLLEFVSDQIAVAIDRKKTFEELEVSRQYLAKAQSVAKLGSWYMDVKRKTIKYSDEVYNILEIEDKSELVSIEDFYKYIPKDEENKVITPTEEKYDKKLRYHDFEHKVLTNKGNIKIVNQRVEEFFDKDGYSYEAVGIIHDVTEIKEAQEEIKKNEENFRQVTELSPYPIFLMNKKGVIEYINPKFTNTFGYILEDIPTAKEWLEKAYKAPLDDKTKRKNFRFDIIKFSEEKIFSRSMNILTKNNLIRNVVHKFMIMKDGKIYGIFEDVTESMKILEENMKHQKLESIGILAGGIAHDFNNILTSILGNITLAKLYKDKQEKQLAKLDSAEAAAIRARDLAKQLLTFSKGGAPVKKTASLGQIVKEASEFSLRGAKVKLELNIENDLWLSDIDEGQISQVVNNLVINASQAMPEGGKIFVSVENKSVSLDMPSLTNGNYVLLKVKDQGTGIPEDVLDKIFDPYFTTKEKGSGLGLATTFSIIKKHKGEIFVDSKANEGTEFSIYLPASEKKSDKKENKISLLSDVKLSGNILVMDDDESVRETCKDMLGYLGLKSDFAEDGDRAIKMYKKRLKSKFKSKYDVVIMDLTVPGGMGGKETIKEILKIDKNVKALVSTGYSNDPVVSSFKDFGFSGVVSKPYKIDELKTAITNILSRK